MNTEQKAQAYDKALEIARQYYEKDSMNAFLDTIFPELAESEDERIRKRLIEYFEGFRMGNAEVKWEGLNVQEVLVWLEKQKEQPDFPTTDEQMKEFLATHPKIKVPEKYKNPDWLLKKQEQAEVDGIISML